MWKYDKGKIVRIITYEQAIKNGRHCSRISAISKFGGQTAQIVECVPDGMYKIVLTDENFVNDDPDLECVGLVSDYEWYEESLLPVSEALPEVEIEPSEYKSILFGA